MNTSKNDIELGSLHNTSFYIHSNHFCSWGIVGTLIFKHAPFGPYSRFCKDPFCYMYIFHNNIFLIPEKGKNQNFIFRK